MFESDVLQKLQRLSYLEKQIMQGQLLSIDNVSNLRELLVCNCCKVNKPTLCDQCVADAIEKVIE